MVSKRTIERPPDRVDRAVASVRAAVGRLVELLGDEERATLEKAALALAEIGPSSSAPWRPCPGHSRRGTGRRSPGRC